MNVAVVVGAGVSAELGVPAMREMAEAFRAHLRDNRYPQSTLERVDGALSQGGYDMETLIDDLNITSRAAQTDARWGLSENRERNELLGLREEAEWLVSHLCERADGQRAERLWAPALRATKRVALTIATTNYDRAIELAAVPAAVHLDDGFPPFSGEEWVAWEGFAKSTGPKLLKSHGSTDWYHDIDRRRVWKLRHPMPVFGAIRITTDAEPAVSLGSALVLPSQEKMVRNAPYPAIAFELRKALEAADLAVFIGTSLRDPDLFDLAELSAARAPTVVVNRSPRPVPGSAVQMSSSRFLISLLPRMLRAPDAPAAADLATSESGQPDPILDDLVVALDVKIDTGDRLAAIDRLAANRVSFEAAEIVPLLRDASSEIQTYALGLVRDSPDSSELGALIEQIASAAESSIFAREAEILKRLG